MLHNIIDGIYNAPAESWSNAGDIIFNSPLVIGIFIVFIISILAGNK